MPRLSAIGILAAVLAGCALDDHPVVYIKNATTIPVEVVIVYTNGETVITDELPPGAAWPYDRIGRCEQAFLIARDANGQEVARSGPPVCRPSEWIITSTEPSPGT